jgi:hypothetical protein
VRGFSSILKADRRTLGTVAAILVLAASLRFVHIGWSFSNNGVDEGIMVERSLLVDRGYGLYTDIPTDQAPLAFVAGSLLGGDVVALRTMVATLSMLAIVACMWASRKMKGDTAMLVTGALLAVDFPFLRESRLFSLDALSSVFLAFSAVSFIFYLRGKGRGALAAAGLAGGIATSMKLFGAVGVVATVVFIAHEMLAKRDSRRSRLLDIVILLATALLPVVLLMLYLGPSDMLNGMLFDQGHRQYDLFLKLSVLAYFGLNLGYLLPLLYARAAWRLSRETKFMLVLTVFVAGFIVLQPLTMLHHMVMVSPILAMLTGVLVGEWSARKKGGSETKVSDEDAKKGRPSRMAFFAILAVGLVVSAGLGSYGVLSQNEPRQLFYSELLKQVTLPEDWVVSGDPLIPAYAGRMVPPEAVNVAYRVFPELTQQDLERIILEYNVSVVIVCYRLNDMPGLAEFLASNDYVYLTTEGIGGDEAVLDLFQEGLGHITVWTDAEATARMAALTSGSS